MDSPPVQHGNRPPVVREPAITGPALEVEALSKRYGTTTVLDGVSFAVEPGQVFGLLGPNGAGKTTTISIVTTLVPADSGRVLIGGFDTATQQPRVRPLIGLVPQEIGLFPMLSARENLEYFAGIQGLSGADAKRRVSEALAIVALEDHANKPRTQFFSGGMLRRLNLACGLVHRPRLLLLDEPTVGVDTQSRSLILDNIKRLSRDEGIAVVYTTHYMEEAESLCDAVAIIDHGRVLACDSVQSLVSSASGTTIEVTLSQDVDTFATALAAMPGISSVEAQDDRRYAFQAVDQERGLGALVGLVGQQGLTFEELRIIPPSLEQVFLSLTGHDMRDTGSE